MKLSNHQQFCYFLKIAWEKILLFFFLIQLNDYSPGHLDNMISLANSYPTKGHLSATPRKTPTPIMWKAGSIKDIENRTVAGSQGTSCITGGSPTSSCSPGHRSLLLYVSGISSRNAGSQFQFQVNETYFYLFKRSQGLE